MSDLTQAPTISMSVEHLSNETPQAVKWVYRTIMFLSGFWAIVLEPQFTALPDDVLHNIDKWLMIGNTGIYFVCQFFGWRQPNQNQ